MGTRVVLDTNIVLDAFVFNDEAARPMKTQLQAGGVCWLATCAMRDELERVLGYPKIALRLAFHQLTAQDVLAAFDRHSERVEAAAKAPVTCKDPDDQKFIDLAAAHRCLLLSKDAAVLAMGKRLAALGAGAAAAWPV